MTGLVQLANVNDVAVITLNRPDVRNAINDEMRAEFVSVIEQVGNDNAVRAVVLTGSGQSFCSGGDVGGMKGRLAAPAGDVAFNGWRRQKQTHKSVAALHGLGKPTIAAVNGAAAGLGCDMALACDFIIASEEAMFMMSFIKRGLVSDGGGMYFLPRRVGLSRAKELIFTGRSLAAAEALAIGLADRVSPAATLIDDAAAWGARTRTRLQRGDCAVEGHSRSHVRDAGGTALRAWPRSPGDLLHYLATSGVRCRISRQINPSGALRCRSIA